MSHTHWPALSVAAVATMLACSAAHAVTWTTYPGAGCVSEGPAVRPTDGSLRNVNPAFTGYSAFSCPVPRNFSTTGSVPTTYVYIHVKAANGTTDFFCRLRSIDMFGDVADSASVTVPKLVSVSNVKGVWGGAMEVSGPSSQNGYSVILRCNVPNDLASQGGIISYMVRH